MSEWVPQAGQECSERVLVAAPVGRDAPLTARIVRQAGFAVEVCDDMDALCRELEAGAGAAALAEEVLSPQGVQKLNEVLSRQPAWSAVPLVILTKGGSAATIRLPRNPVPVLSRATFLERPVRIITLVSILRAAIEDRRRQYQVRGILQELHDGVRKRDEFLAVLGHELRNPLAPIANAVEVLRHRTEPPDPVVQWAREVIGRQVTQLTRLVNDLLDVARITQGRIELKKEVVDLAEIAARAVELMRPALEARRHTLTTTLPSQPITLEADPVRLTQIIGNLLDNAAKYTPEGGRIALSAAQKGREAVIRVQDTGIGIAPEQLPRLFEAFAQVERGREGLGLGLTVSQRLAKMHGGSIRAESAGLGQGSTFIVRLPLPERSIARIDRTAVPHAAARRILVVEDGPDVAESFALLLRAWGHEVRVARDGAAGLQAARDFRPDLVFLDIGLPDMDGYAVARRLRAEQGSTLRLVALTGYGQDDDRRRGREVGFDGYLLKPVDSETLERLLASVATSTG